MIESSSRVAGVVVIVCTLLLTGGCVEHATPGVYLRVNQVGYLPGDPKIAMLSSDRRVTGGFSVGSYSADVGRDEGAWGPFAHNYRLDFTPLRAPGRYRLRA